MSNSAKQVEAVADMEKDFAQWYTDVVRKAELADYAETGGCIIFQPYGYAIWELIQKELDARFKETGHENVYMPALVPERLLKMEQDHVEGFAPEVMWVTRCGDEALAERMYLRPTSEPLFGTHFANIIQSYRDLPKLYNQWCSVFRWEKNTRPFLRTREFLWQEGHTAHATAEEAQEETLRMLNVYAEFSETILAVPSIRGRKTEREKFAGAVASYSFESLMHDGKSLQTGTSHYLGDKFAKAFGIQYLGKDNQLKHVYQSSWGVTSRLIGSVIMVHGDNNGLVLPPGVAPVQVIVVPVAQHKPGVLDFAQDLNARLKKSVRCKVDMSDKSPGWKFAEHEMKGVPIRLEIGPKDIENNQAVLARRDTGAKTVIPLAGIEDAVAGLLKDIHNNLYQKAKNAMDERTYAASTLTQMKEILDTTPGFVKALWCGDGACEERVKTEAAATSRCIPFDQGGAEGGCAVCGKPAKTMVVWGRAY